VQRPLGWISRADRQEVVLIGTALLPDGRDINVGVQNLSPDGCRLRSDETLAIGDEILLATGYFEPVRGKVRWSLLGTAGVRFSVVDET
jgi:hypothetical protein